MTDEELDQLADEVELIECWAGMEISEWQRDFLRCASRDGRYEAVKLA